MYIGDNNEIYAIEGSDTSREEPEQKARKPSFRLCRKQSFLVCGIGLRSKGKRARTFIYSFSHPFRFVLWGKADRQTEPCLHFQNYAIVSGWVDN